MSDIPASGSAGENLEARVEVTRIAHVANVQTKVRAITRILGFPEMYIFRAAISASELASNLVYHTTAGGTISIKGIRKKGCIGIEIISDDSGPGIKDVNMALQDGYSTGPGLGSGLPAVERLMDELEILVTDDFKTCIRSRLWYFCE
ncbi:MAG: anti-sigma regulatory factor [Methanolobus sp. T82-4]|jgi:serine/threonine-protein kinase RsbT|nr:MAG: anti-sigma regulatory factor [Methanolobus sp. T82-4]